MKVLCLLVGGPLLAQHVGVGTQAPHSSAQLDVFSDSRGLLVPRVALSNAFLAAPVSSPAVGLLVWNTNASLPSGQGVGFYYWSGSRWQKLTNQAEGWALLGNQVDTATHFLGTTNNAGIVFKVHNQKAGGLFPNSGNTFLGGSAGALVKAIGDFDEGTNNTLIGASAGEKMIGGRLNTFVGSRSGLNSQSGLMNTFIGYQTGAGNTTGNLNIAIGGGAGGQTTGSRNIAIGANAGGSLGNGYENVLMGHDAGWFLLGDGVTPYYGNIIIGSNAGTGNFGINPKFSSFNNTIVGDSAAFRINGAIGNVYIGKRSGLNSQTGDFNVFVGDSSGLSNTSGSQNTYVGSKARGNAGNLVNATAIGAHAQVNTSNSMVLGSIAGVNGATQSVHVGIGTTTPGAKLHVVNGTSTGVNFSGNSSLVLDRAGGSNHLSMLIDANSEAALIFGRTGSAQPPFDGGIFYNTGGSGAMQFRNKAGLTRLVLHDDGNVSVGTVTNVARFFIPLSTPSAITPFNNSTLVLDGGNSFQYLSMVGTGLEHGILFGNSNSNRDGGIFYDNLSRALTFRTSNANNRMVIASSGNIGMGTTNPEYKLHVRTALAGNNGIFGGLMLENTNPTNPEAAISFKTAGATGTGTNQWMIGLNANRNFSLGYGTQFLDASTRMVLDSTGRLGIGVLTPGFQLHLSQNSAAKPGSNTWTVSSDERLKKDMHPFEDGLEVLRQIDPIWFTYTGAENHPQEQFVGTTAQALKKVAPYMVTTLKEKSEVGDRLLGVDYGPMQFILINAIKEQQRMLEAQQQKIDLLEKMLQQGGKKKRRGL